MKKYDNFYFIIGNAYAGKSTMLKMLAKEYNGILCEENYADRLVDEHLSKIDFPALTYLRDLKDFRDFIRRTPDEYEAWVNGCIKECTILELKILEEYVNSEKLVFVDTNISLEKLKEISDKDHVLVMLNDPKESVRRFFEREDREKQMMYQLLKTEPNPEKAMDNFRKCLERINSQENYDYFMNSGFNVLKRDDSRTLEETLEIVKMFFKLK